VQGDLYRVPKEGLTWAPVPGDPVPCLIHRGHDRIPSFSCLYRKLEASLIGEPD